MVTSKKTSWEEAGFFNLFLALVSVCLVAVGFLLGASVSSHGGEIPPRYDHAFRGRVVVNEGLGPCADMPVWGCTAGAQRGRCVVFVQPGLPRAFRGKVVRHEIAHCNGWSTEHER